MVRSTRNSASEAEDKYEFATPKASSSSSSRRRVVGVLRSSLIGSSNNSSSGSGGMISHLPLTSSSPPLPPLSSSSSPVSCTTESTTTTAAASGTTSNTTTTTTTGGRRLPMREASRESLREQMLTVKAGCSFDDEPQARSSAFAVVAEEEDEEDEEELVVVEESLATTTTTTPPTPQRQLQLLQQQQHLTRRSSTPDFHKQKRMSWDGVGSSSAGGSSTCSSGIGHVKSIRSNGAGAAGGGGWMLKNNNKSSNKRAGTPTQELFSLSSPSRSGTKSKKTKSVTAKMTRMLLVAMCAALCATTACKLALNNANFWERHESAVRRDARQLELVALRGEYQGQLDVAKRRGDLLQQSLEEARHDASSLRMQLSRVQNVREEYRSLRREWERLVRYKTKTGHHLQILSRNLLFRAFGPGPHYVEIHVAFDPESNIAASSASSTNNATTTATTNEGTIIIEMAPADEMPFTVFWFLEQVSRKLFDGCSFDRYAGHVLQATPTGNFLSITAAASNNDNATTTTSTTTATTTTTTTTTDVLHKRFLDAGFYSVLFQEYSPRYPHKKYTLGYGGRPGGPDFYINLEDNTRSHGPYGQVKQSDGQPDEEADPAFARVVAGFDVVERMKRSDVVPGGYHLLKHAIAIRSMSIIKNPPPPPSLTQQQQRQQEQQHAGDDEDGDSDGDGDGGDHGSDGGDDGGDQNGGGDKTR